MFEDLFDLPRLDAHTYQKHVPAPVLSDAEVAYEKDAGKQKKQTWPTHTGKGNGRQPGWCWVPKMNPLAGSNDRARPCSNKDERIQCCKKAGGAWWLVHDPIVGEASLLIAEDPTKYCPDCFVKEKQRVGVTFGDYSASNKKKKSMEAEGLTVELPKRQKVVQEIDKPAKIPKEPKEKVPKAPKKARKQRVTFICSRHDNSSFSIRRRPRSRSNSGIMTWRFSNRCPIILLLLKNIFMILLLLQTLLL